MRSPNIVLHLVFHHHNYMNELVIQVQFLYKLLIALCTFLGSYQCTELSHGACCHGAHSGYSSKHLWKHRPTNRTRVGCLPDLPFKTTLVCTLQQQMELFQPDDSERAATGCCFLAKLIQIAKAVPFPESSLSWVRKPRGVWKCFLKSSVFVFIATFLQRNKFLRLLRE